MADDERYEARIDDFNLEMETIEDTIEKSLAKYEFPFRDGALIEDMGQKARVIKIRCYWYEETYETHKDFVKHLEKKDPFELLHPKYGLMKGSIDSIVIRHSDLKKTAEVDITFTEGLITKGAAEPKYVNKGAVDWGVEDDFATGQASSSRSLETTSGTSSGPRRRRSSRRSSIPRRPYRPVHEHLRAGAGVCEEGGGPRDGPHGDALHDHEPRRLAPCHDHLPEHPSRYCHRDDRADPREIRLPLRHAPHVTDAVSLEPQGKLHVPCR
jgi:hypothetical protein